MKAKIRIRNRILSLMLAFVMVLGMMPITNLAALAATTPTPYDGVPVTPTKITSSNYLQFGLTDSNWSSYLKEFPFNI